MIKYDKVKRLLESEPLARERRNRGRAIWFLIRQEDSRIQSEELMTKNIFIDNWPTINSLNRLICKVQQDNESLRGKDYKDKDILEQEKILELGYEPGYYQNVKKLKKI
jgi:hypothetical protein